MKFSLIGGVRRGACGRGVATIAGVPRRLLAALTVWLLVALAGCSSPLDAEHDEIVRALDAVLGDLRADNYAGASGRLCAPPASSADDLHEEFAGYAKPWRTEVTGSEFSSHASGLVNVLLTAADGRKQPYTFDVSYRDGRWQVCSYHRGTYGYVD